MHIQASTTQATDIQVAVSEPWAGTDGTVFGPDIEVRPFGMRPDSGHYWSLSLAEARELAAKLNSAVADAEALFGQAG